MNVYRMLLIVGCFSFVGNLSYAECPHCNGSGCCWEDVVKYRCVEVPDVKPVKKIFYECKCIPFCTPSLPPFLHCDCESGCDCVRFKRVLVKREVQVGEHCGTKCVVEQYVERVQVPCCHCDCCDNCEEGAQPQQQKAPSARRTVPHYQY